MRCRLCNINETHENYFVCVICFDKQLNKLFDLDKDYKKELQKIKDVYKKKRSNIVATLRKSNAQLTITRNDEIYQKIMELRAEKKTIKQIAEILGMTLNQTNYIYNTRRVMSK